MGCVRPCFALARPGWIAAMYWPDLVADIRACASEVETAVEIALRLIRDLLPRYCIIHPWQLTFQLAKWRSQLERESCAASVWAAAYLLLLNAMIPRTEIGQDPRGRPTFIDMALAEQPLALCMADSMPPDLDEVAYEWIDCASRGAMSPDMAMVTTEAGDILYGTAALSWLKRANADKSAVGCFTMSPADASAAYHDRACIVVLWHKHSVDVAVVAFDSALRSFPLPTDWYDRNWVGFFRARMLYA